MTPVVIEHYLPVSLNDYIKRNSIYMADASRVEKLTTASFIVNKGEESRQIPNSIAYKRHKPRRQLDPVPHESDSSFTFCRWKLKSSSRISRLIVELLGIVNSMNLDLLRCG